MNNNERANSILRQRTLLIMDLKNKLNKLQDLNKVLRENNLELTSKLEDLESRLADFEKEKTFSQSKKFKVKKDDPSEPTTDS